MILIKLTTGFAGFPKLKVGFWNAARFEIGLISDEADTDYDVVVAVARDKFPTTAVFDNLYVNNAQGTPVPLNQVAQIGFETSPMTINHYNKNRFAKITAYTRTGVLANTVLKDVVPKLDALKLPADYSCKLSGEAESEGDAFGGSFITVILLTVFLFIGVIILQFKTFKGTLIVLSVILLGVVGGVTMLFLTGNPLSFSASSGLSHWRASRSKIRSCWLISPTNSGRRACR